MDNNAKDIAETIGHYLSKKCEAVAKGSVLIENYVSSQVKEHERLLRECEKELEDSELRQKITEMLSRKQM